MYTSAMDVSVSDLRAHLSQWIDRARQGEAVVITDRVLPVVRLVGIEASGQIDQLEAAGTIGRPMLSDRPGVPERPPMINPGETLSDIVAEQRAE